MSALGAAYAKPVSQLRGGQGSSLPCRVKPNRQPRRDLTDRWNSPILTSRPPNHHHIPGRCAPLDDSHYGTLMTGATELRRLIRATKVLVSAAVAVT
jgi:hypothetical protein